MAVPCLFPYASLTHCSVNLQSPRGFLLPLTSCTELVESPAEYGGVWVFLIPSIWERLLICFI